MRLAFSRMHQEKFWPLSLNLKKNPLLINNKKKTHSLAKSQTPSSSYSQKRIEFLYYLLMSTSRKARHHESLSLKATGLRIWQTGLQCHTVLMEQRRTSLRSFSISKLKVYSRKSKKSKTAKELMKKSNETTCLVWVLSQGEGGA